LLYINEKKRFFIVALITVIGILIALTMHKYQDHIETARINAAYTRLLELQAPAVEYAMSNQAWPTKVEELGFTAAELEYPEHKYSIDVYDNGVIAAHVGNDKADEKQYIVLSPQVIEGDIEWACFGDKIKVKYLPLECQE
jgi:Tfp pilus assembly protein PilE